VSSQPAPCRKILGGPGIPGSDFQDVSCFHGLQAHPQFQYQVSAPHITCIPLGIWVRPPTGISFGLVFAIISHAHSLFPFRPETSRKGHGVEPFVAAGPVPTRTKAFVVIDISEEMIPELFASLCKARGQARQAPRTILEANRQADDSLVAAYIRPAGVAASSLHMLQVL